MNSTSKIQSAFSKVFVGVSGDTYGQNRIISALQGMGYKGNKEGMCSGITHFWEQAVLCGEEDNFMGRLRFIDATYARIHNNLLKEYEKIPPQVFNAKREIYTKELQDRTAKLMAEEINSIRTKVKAGKQSGQPYQLSKEEEQWLDTQAFFEGIELYQNVRDYPDIVAHGRDKALLETDSIFAITASEKLQNQGGAVNLFEETWMFDHTKQLPGANAITYFENLSKILEKVPEHNRLPFSLSAESHRIGLKFCGKDIDGNYLWQLRDPNGMTRTPMTIPELENAIQKAILDTVPVADKKNNTETVFTLRLFTTGDRKDSAEIKNLENDLLKFRNSHEVTGAIKVYDKINHNKLQNLAIKSMDVNLATKLSGTYDLDKEGFEDFTSAIYIADNKKISQFAKAGVNLNKSIKTGSEKGKTIAHIAAKQGDLELLRIIDSHGGSLNKYNLAAGINFGRTPLYYAKKNNHIAAVNFIRSVKKRDVLLKSISELEKKFPNKDILNQLKTAIKEDWKKHDEHSTHADFNMKNWANVIKQVKSGKPIPDDVVIKKANVTPTETKSELQVLMQNYNELTTKQERTNFINAYLRLPEELRMEVLESQTATDLQRLQESFTTTSFADFNTSQDNELKLIAASLANKENNQHVIHPKILLQFMIENKVTDADKLRNLQLIKEDNGQLYIKGQNEAYAPPRIFTTELTQTQLKIINDYQSTPVTSQKQNLQTKLEAHIANQTEISMTNNSDQTEVHFHKPQ